MSSSDFPLGRPGFRFSDLYDPARLKALHDDFWTYVSQREASLPGRFQQAHTLTKPKEAEVLVEVARHLGSYLTDLFSLQKETRAIQAETHRWSPVWRLKGEFLGTRVFKRFNEAPLDSTAFSALEAKVKKLVGEITETSLAEKALPLLAAEKASKVPSPELKLIEDWCAQVYVDPVRRKKVSGWLSYVRPGKLDFENLVPVERPDSALAEKITGHLHHRRHRDGFTLTDPA